MVLSTRRVLISPFPTGRLFERVKALASEYSKVQSCGFGRATEGIVIVLDSPTLALAAVDMFNGRKEKAVMYSARLCSDEDFAEWKIVYTLPSKAGSAESVRPHVVGLCGDGANKKVRFV